MATIPLSTKVLVIGGGPAGSYAAAALALEGIDVVVLELDRHPRYALVSTLDRFRLIMNDRYHVGESMLPSIRKFLGLIGCEAKFAAHGFIRKNGGAFKLNGSKPVVYTDFLTGGGPESYAWNVVRSEADAILFRHAAECGAHAFDGVKVESIEFADDGKRPVSASWKRNDEARDKGTIHFDYLIDASGRNGLLSTRHLRNRKFNSNLKNTASWGYWRGGLVYGAGTEREGYPFFEALADGQGWAWYIPLHNGTHSVGVVQKLDAATARRRAWGGSPSPRDFYLRCLDEMVPHIRHELLAQATPLGECEEPEGTGLRDVHTASDWSYSASTYALPHARIIGDAGCFVDPFFSSGMHVALTTALSAAVTVAASIRGDCAEEAAGSWHTKRVSETYTRFFLVVSASMKQIGAQDDPVLSDVDEEGFDRAFEHFRPVIQGTVDTTDSEGRKKLTQAEIARTVEFCVKRFTNVKPEQMELVLQKLQAMQLDGEHAEDDHGGTARALAKAASSLTPDELAVFEVLQSRKMLRTALFDDEAMFSIDAIDSLAPRLERGQLGLSRVDEQTKSIPAKALLDGMAASSHLKFTSRVDGNKDNDSDSSNEPEMMHCKKDTNGKAGTKAATQVLTEQEINQLMEPIRRLSAGGASTLDRTSRMTLMAALHAAAEHLETRTDTIQRFYNGPRLLPLVRVGQQLDLFRTLAFADKAMSIEELSRPTKADQALVQRIVRCLAATGMVGEVAVGRYTANAMTHRLADPKVSGALQLSHHVQAPTLQLLPAFLEKHGFRNPAGPDKCVWYERATLELENVKVPDGTKFHDWMKMQPEHSENYNKRMEISWTDESSSWLDVTEDLFQNTSGHGGDGPVFVDMGGNLGQQCARLLHRHAHLGGRIVLQDLPGVILEARATAAVTAGVLTMAHDFFTPQPVRGAPVYFLRNILHNYADADCLRILRHTAAAMQHQSRSNGPSRLLLDGMVLPDCVSSTATGTLSTCRNAICLDLNMMTFFGGMERDENQWARLLAEAGLRIVDVRHYAPAMAVIVAETMSPDEL